MSHPPSRCKSVPPRRFLGALLLVPLLFLPAFVQSAPAPVKRLAADSALKTQTSLGFVPADVSFYYASLRMKEQLDWLLKTRAFAKVKDLPMVQEAWQRIQDEWQNNKDFTAARRFLQVKENQQLVAMLGEMVSDEIFVAGGANVPEFFELLTELAAGVFTAPLSALASGHLDEESQNKARVQAILQAASAAAKNKKLHIPDLVIGFHIKDKEVAKAQLSRLENLVGFAVGFVPELKGKLKRAETAGGDFLTLTLQGQMLPWKDIPIKEFEEDPGDFDDLVAYLKKLTFTIGIGIKGDYVVLSFGESLRFAETLGKGPSLAERDELKVLAPHAGKRLSSLGYVSKAMASFGASSPEATEQAIAENLDELLAFLDLPEDKKKALLKDFGAIVADFAKFETKPGAVVSCGYLTEQGEEGFSYDYSIYPTQDASRPLSLAQHVGGNPIFAYVGRSKLSLEQWDTLVKSVKLIWKHVDELGVARLPEDWQERYKEVMTWLRPLIVQYETTTRTRLLPALADGQFGIVLDGKLLSKQWVADMKEADEPVPAPELAFVWGVSDAGMLKTAMQEYRQTTNSLLEKVVDLSGGLIPELKIPQPKTQSLAVGTAWFYPLPPEMIAEIGLDKQILPAAGLSDRTACLALSVGHVERLLKPTPLSYGSELPLDFNRPAASILVFDHLALQDALRPWVNYGLKQALAEAGDEEKKEIARYGPQVQTILDCTRMFRRHASVTYVENGVTVSRSFTSIRDID